MAPYEIRDATIRELRATREAMLGLDYLLALETLPPEEREAAALQLSNVQLAYLRLRRVELDEMRQALLENEDQLRAGRAALAEAREDLEDVARVIRAVDGFLRVVGRVVDLL